jgi:hypothetical protein
MYKIVITKTEVVEEYTKKQWENINQRPLTQEEYDEAAYYKREEWEEAERPILVWEKGYTPQEKAMKSRTLTVLEQTVDEMDLQSVIKAINGIE